MDDGDPGYVKFKPPRKAAFGLMGIHSTDRLTAKSLDEAADKFLAGWKKNFRKRALKSTLTKAATLISFRS